MDPELHPDLTSLSFLLATWRGEGDCTYPTIESSHYGEELTFSHVGEPYLVYTQRSWMPEDNAPVHLERGFLRPGAEGEVELALAHPLGLTEIAHGTLHGTGLELSTAQGGVGRAHTGLAVTGIVRRYRVDGDVLRYEVDMATEDTPMTRHLVAELRKVPA
jgi:hypothetical protein